MSKSKYCCTAKTFQQTEITTESLKFVPRNNFPIRSAKRTPPQKKKHSKTLMQWIFFSSVLKFIFLYLLAFPYYTKLRKPLLINDFFQVVTYYNSNVKSQSLISQSILNDTVFSIGWIKCWNNLFLGLDNRNQQYQTKFLSKQRKTKDIFYFSFPRTRSQNVPTLSSSSHFSELSSSISAKNASKTKAMTWYCNRKQKLGSLFVTAF